MSAGASEFYKLAADLSQVTAKTIPALRGGMALAGEAVARSWRNNAIQTSGEHGKHYPDSIDSELVFSITEVAVDVGPNKAKKQGGMSFEFGSRNQPPHLDGLRALDGIEPQVEKIIDLALNPLFP